MTSTVATCRLSSITSDGTVPQSAHASGRREPDVGQLKWPGSKVTLAREVGGELVARRAT